MDHQMTTQKKICLYKNCNTMTKELKINNERNKISLQKLKATSFH